MKEADKHCVNCNHCKREQRKGQIECICKVTGMGIFYVGLFTHRCEKWEEDEWK